MARTTSKLPKGVSVNAVISKTLFDALEDHRWSARMTMPEVVRTAIEMYAQSQGITPQNSGAVSE